MANFVDWFQLAGLIMAVESGIGNIKHAVGKDAKAAAIAQLVDTVVHAVERLSGKTLVNDPQFHALINDVLSAIADAPGVKA
jgi:hypothetical protein